MVLIEKPQEESMFVQDSIMSEEHVFNEEETETFDATMPTLKCTPPNSQNL